jgi:outer membrane protein
MNRILSVGAFVAASALLVAVPASAQTAGSAPTKIGVLEVQRIVAESAVGKESLARVQKVQAQKQEDLTKRQNDLKELEKKIQDQSKSLSEEALDKLQKDYQSKALEFKRAQDDAQRELEELQRRELGELEKKVMPVIDSVAREQGYFLVFNKFQSGLLFADVSSDLTDAVITKFNSQIATAPKADAKAPPAKPAASPAPAKPAPAAPKKN